MALVALDTNILIWCGMRELPRDESDDPALAERARFLLHRLERDAARIVVPAISAAEWAVPIAPEKRAGFLDTLNKQFFVKAFDLQSAAIAADLYAKAKTIPEEERTKRQVLSADIKIIATAKAAGATVFYTHDKKCRRVARLIMPAEDLPTHGDELFDGQPMSDD